MSNEQDADRKTTVASCDLLAVRMLCHERDGLRNKLNTVASRLNEIEAALAKDGIHVICDERDRLRKELAASDARVKELEEKINSLLGCIYKLEAACKAKDEALHFAYENSMTPAVHRKIEAVLSSDTVALQPADALAPVVEALRVIHADAHYINKDWMVQEGHDEAAKTVQAIRDKAKAALAAIGENP